MTWQDPPPEGDRLAAVGEDREQHPCAERVLQLAPRVAKGEPVVVQQLGVDPRLAGERVPVVRRPPDLELAGDVAAQPTATQVIPSRARVGRVEQPIVVPVDRLLHRLHEALAPGSLLGLRGRRVRDRDAGLGGQLLDRPDEVDVVDLLDEREHVAGLVAPEALVAPGLLAHVERRRPLGVERAQPDPVAACALELDVLTDDVDDRRGRPYPLDVVVGDRH
jgi:hypothetical protein